jgi:hypothetical protein
MDHTPGTNRGIAPATAQKRFDVGVTGAVSYHWLGRVIGFAGGILAGGGVPGRQDNAFDRLGLVLTLAAGAFSEPVIYRGHTVGAARTLAGQGHTNGTHLVAAIAAHHAGFFVGVAGAP